MLKNWVTFVSLTLSVVFVAGCQKKTDSTLNDVIRIGEVGTMTGSEASFGLSTHRGVSMAVEKINSTGGILGKKLQLINIDDQGKAEETTSAATKLITQNHVVAFVGGHPSSRGLAVSPVAQKFKIPYVHSGSTHPKVTEVGDFIFRVCFTDPFQGHVMAKFALENLKLKRVAILRDMKSDYSLGLTEFFSSTLRKGGGEVVVEQSYGSGDIDFKSQLTAIRAKSPEVIFVPGYYTEAALIARQARDLGLTQPLLGADGWDSPKFLEIGGAAVQGAYFSTHYSSESKSTEIQDFVAQYRSNYHVTPDGLATLGYDGMMVLADAIRRSGSGQPAEIQKALAKTNGFQGITGRITLDEKRNPIKSAVILRVDEGKAKFYTTIQP